jgi:hypothetical protein
MTQEFIMASRFPNFITCVLSEELEAVSLDFLNPWICPHLEQLEIYEQ